MKLTLLGILLHCITMTPRRSPRLNRCRVELPPPSSTMDLCHNDDDVMKTPVKPPCIPPKRSPLSSVRVNTPSDTVISERPSSDNVVASGTKRKPPHGDHDHLRSLTPNSKCLVLGLYARSPSHVRRSFNLDNIENLQISADDQKVPVRVVSEDCKVEDSKVEDHKVVPPVMQPSEECEVPPTPALPSTASLPDQTHIWNPKDLSHNNAIKAALHLSVVPTTIICREEELNRVFGFAKLCIERKRVGSMYVCGCPGTGKSLLLEKVKQLSPEWAKEVGMLPPNSVTVNCTSLTNVSDIFKKILEQFPGRRKCSSGISALQELKNLLCEEKASSANKMTLLVVDEMDYLISKDQSVLYDLFKLPTLPNSHCMLIGISNAIDLTDRLLPKLQSLNCKPLVVTFRAYSKDQILKILQQRLMGLPYNAFQKEALELCARKVAAASGDMRKALHVCRNAVELLEAELKDDNNENDTINEKSDANESSQQSKVSTKQECNIVRIDHMARALAKTFRSAVVDTVQSLPRHQQIVLCSAVKFFRSGKKDCTLGELHSAYLKFCKTTLMCPLTGPEFSSMCRVLCDQALLNLGKSQEDRLRRVTLRVDEGDVTFALQGIRFFRNSLQ